MTWQVARRSQAVFTDWAVLPIHTDDVWYSAAQSTSHGTKQNPIPGLLYCGLHAGFQHAVPKACVPKACLHDTAGGVLVSSIVH